MPTIAFDAIGVRWEIDTDAPLRDTTRAVIRERIETYDRTWSRYRTDSLVSAIADAPGTWRLPPEAGPLLELYRQLHEATDGRVSPLAAAGRPAGTWADAIAWDGEWLQAPRPVELDVAAAGKGQLVDLVTEVLADGVATALFFTEDLPSTLGAQWARMDTAGRIRTSPDWPGEVFT